MPSLETYKGLQRVTPTPTGDAGQALNTNFTFCADKIEAHDAHVASTANPHATTAAQVGAYTTAQVDTALASKANTNTANTFTGGLQTVTTTAGGAGVKINAISTGSANTTGVAFEITTDAADNGTAAVVWRISSGS